VQDFELFRRSFVELLVFVRIWKKNVSETMLFFAVSCLHDL